VGHTLRSGAHLFFSRGTKIKNRQPVAVEFNIAVRITAKETRDIAFGTKLDVAKDPSAVYARKPRARRGDLS
jgi:hypothetical protein